MFSFYTTRIIHRLRRKKIRRGAMFSFFFYNLFSPEGNMNIFTNFLGKMLYSCGMNVFVLPEV